MRNPPPLILMPTLRAPMLCPGPGPWVVVGDGEKVLDQCQAVLDPLVQRGGPRLTVQRLEQEH